MSSELTIGEKSVRGVCVFCEVSKSAFEGEPSENFRGIIDYGELTKNCGSGVFGHRCLNNVAVENFRTNLTDNLLVIPDSAFAGW